MVGLGFKRFVSSPKVLLDGRLDGLPLIGGAVGVLPGVDVFDRGEGVNDLLRVCGIVGPVRLSAGSERRGHDGGGGGGRGCRRIAGEAAIIGRGRNHDRGGQALHRGGGRVQHPLQERGIVRGLGDGVHVVFAQIRRRRGDFHAAFKPVDEVAGVVEHKEFAVALRIQGLAGLVGGIGLEWRRGRGLGGGLCDDRLQHGRLCFAAVLARLGGDGGLRAAIGRGRCRAGATQRQRRVFSAVAWLLALLDGRRGFLLGADGLARRPVKAEVDRRLLALFQARRFLLARRGLGLAFNRQVVIQRLFQRAEIGRLRQGLNQVVQHRLAGHFIPPAFPRPVLGARDGAAALDLAARHPDHFPGAILVIHDGVSADHLLRRVVKIGVDPANVAVVDCAVFVGDFDILALVNQPGAQAVHKPGVPHELDHAADHRHPLHDFLLVGGRRDDFAVFVLRVVAEDHKSALAPIGKQPHAGGALQGQPKGCLVGVQQAHVALDRHHERIAKIVIGNVRREQLRVFVALRFGHVRDAADLFAGGDLARAGRAGAVRHLDLLGQVI